jgi:hypothetical protein
LAVEDYLDPEARARIEIDRQLAACGWIVQDYKKLNLGAGIGVAVREFKMSGGYDTSDYVLFVNRNAAGVIEAKKAGSTLTGVEWQSAKYTSGLPEGISAIVKPLPFAFESTGVETRFTNGFDADPASRQVFTFYRPETLAEIGSERATLRARLRELPELNEQGYGCKPRFDGGSLCVQVCELASGGIPPQHRLQPLPWAVRVSLRRLEQSWTTRVPRRTKQARGKLLSEQSPEVNECQPMLVIC